MKKIIFFSILLFLTILNNYADEYNIITNDNKLLKGEIIGKTEDLLFVKDSEGNVKEIELKNIKQIFDTKTGKPYYLTKTEPVTKTESTNQETKQEVFIYDIPKQEPYEVLESGTIVEEHSVFKRTGSWFEFDLNIMYLFSYWWYEPLRKIHDNLGPSIFLIFLPSGISIAPYIRPFDFLAIGVFYNLSSQIADDWDNNEASLVQLSSGLTAKFIFNSRIIRDKNNNKFETNNYLLLQVGYSSLGKGDSDISENGKKVASFFGYAPMYVLGYGMTYKIFHFNFAFVYCYYDEVTVRKREAPAIQPILPLSINASGALLQFGVNL